MPDLNLKKFQPVRIADKKIIQGFITKYDFLSCEYNFTNLIIWGKIYDIRWTEYKNALLIYNVLDDQILMPVGREFSPAELRDISESFISQGKHGNFLHVPLQYIKDNPSISDFFNVELEEDFSDYVYSTVKLAHLRGQKLSKKKNLISQFRRNNPEYLCLKLEREFFGECVSLAEKWGAHSQKEDINISNELIALKTVFENFNELDIEGLVLFVDGKIAAFSIFSFQNNHTRIVHFEKDNRKIKGSAQVINWETAKYLLDKCEFINREQDIGLPGLRKSKRSYDPDKILHAYRLCPMG